MATIPVLAANWAEVAPAATETEDGAVRTVVALLASVTVAPPAGAAWLSVTVHVVEAFDESDGAPHCSELTLMALDVPTRVNVTD